ncbi:MAG: N-acetylglucosamine-6-phosphate deacetylase [Chloroflexota bacterium]|nr:MAG: N-acetylglucosamine-6-phosphate deacetylase [Chloroflexota bacterium]
MRLLLTDCFLYTPEEYGPGEVLLTNGRIAEVARRVETRRGAEVISLEGATLAPGLIDVHVHGSNGLDTMDGEAEAIAKLSAFFAAHGVTGFLPTTVAAPLPQIERAMNAVRHAVDSGLPGAQVLGVHLEGPFFNRQRAGAQPVDWCVDPTEDALQRLLTTGEGLIRMMSLSPELPGALAAIEILTRHGIVASLGHTDANYAQAQAAFAAGARHVTHLFNAMSPLHHREPGVGGAALTTAGGRVQIIADGLHLHPATLALVVRCKGVDEVLLITDAIAGAGLPDGEYALGPQRVIVRNGEARTPAGNLAGSTLTLERAVANMVRLAGVSLPAALQMASLNPARVLGLEQHKGRLAPGYDAALAALDADFNVRLTVVGGRVVYPPYPFDIVGKK